MTFQKSIGAFLILLFSTCAANSEKLVVCSDGIPRILDPVISNERGIYDASVSTVFERLVEWDYTNKEAGPSLAESWEVSDNNRTFVFSLRRGVTFHRSEMMPSHELSSTDVVHTFRNLADSNPAYKDAAEITIARYGANSILDIRNVEAIDQHTVKFEFDTPQPNFLRDLSSAPSSIKSHQYLASLRDSGMRDAPPIGTGPFKMISSPSEQSIEYEAHDSHWLGKPYIDRISIINVPDALARQKSLEVGDCDLAVALPTNLKPPTGLGFQSFEKWGIITRPSTRCYFSETPNFGRSLLMCEKASLVQAGKKQCPKCPKTGACPESILAAKKQCCPKSGVCPE